MVKKPLWGYRDNHALKYEYAYKVLEDYLVYKLIFNLLTLSWVVPLTMNNINFVLISFWIDLKEPRAKLFLYKYHLKRGNHGVESARETILRGNGGGAIVSMI